MKKRIWTLILTLPIVLLTSCGGGSTTGGVKPPPRPQPDHIAVGDVSVVCLHNFCELDKLQWIAGQPDKGASLEYTVVNKAGDTIVTPTVISEFTEGTARDFLFDDSEGTSSPLNLGTPDQTILIQFTVKDARGQTLNVDTCQIYPTAKPCT